MQLVVEVFGVEQACDFDTMETKAFVVLNIFGEPIRVPITEEQMAVLTEKATVEHTAQNAGGDLETQFEETRERLTGPPTERGAKIGERAFSPMATLEGRDPDPPAVEEAEEEQPRETDPGFGALFDEEDKESKLRNRNQEARRPRPAADSAGNPVIQTQLPQSRPLPSLGNPASDDDFVQG